MNVDELFIRLEKEAKQKNIDEERIKLLRIIGIEAKAGFPFADRIKKYFPEIVETEG